MYNPDWGVVRTVRAEDKSRPVQKLVPAPVTMTRRSDEPYNFPISSFECGVEGKVFLLVAELVVVVVDACEEVGTSLVGGW